MADKLKNLFWAGFKGFCIKKKEKKNIFVCKLVWFSRYPAITSYNLRSQWESEKEVGQKFFCLFDLYDQREPVGAGRLLEAGSVRNRKLKKQVGSD